MELVKKIFAYLNSYFLGFSLILMIILIYQLYTLPEKINNQLFQDKRDTVIVNKTVTANLGASGSFIYFDGKLIGSKKRMKDSYEYDKNYPTEIFQGWLLEAVSTKQGHYYIWSRTEPQILDAVIQGYFFTDNLSTFGNENNKEYYQILYPIIEKQWKNN